MFIMGSSTRNSLIQSYFKDNNTLDLNMCHNCGSHVDTTRCAKCGSYAIEKRNVPITNLKDLRDKYRNED
jgi:ribosomal protein L37E